MTEEEYLNQEQYFSESFQAFIDIDSMVPQHAAYAFQKLYREMQGSFPGTPLWHAFYMYLRPGKSEIARRLKAKGTASIMLFGNQERPAARGRFYRAGASLGVKVRTHVKAGVMTGEVVTPPTIVRVRGEEVGHA